MYKLLFFLFPSVALANHFSLPKTSSRFILEITATKIFYRSEKVQERRNLNACGLRLARDLNAELLKLVPLKNSAKGIPFMVDGKNFELDPKDPNNSRLLTMDERMLRFFLEEKSCAR